MVHMHTDCLQGAHYVIDNRQAAGGSGLIVGTLGGYPGGISELDAATVTAAGFDPQYMPILDGNTGLHSQMQYQIQEGTASAPVSTHNTAAAAYLMQAAIAGGMLTAPAQASAPAAQGTRMVLGSHNGNDPGMSNLMAAANMTSAAVSSSLLGSSSGLGQGTLPPGIVMTTSAGPTSSASHHNHLSGGGPVMGSLSANMPMQTLNTLAAVGSAGSVQAAGGSRGWVGQSAPAAPALGPDAQRHTLAAPGMHAAGGMGSSALVAHVAARQQQVLAGSQAQGLANLVVASSSSRPGSQAPSVGSAEQLLQAMAELHLHQQHHQQQQQQSQAQQQPQQ